VLGVKCDVYPLAHTHAVPDAREPLHLDAPIRRGRMSITCRFPIEEDQHAGGRYIRAGFFCFLPWEVTTKHFPCG
jgi:hypothetical protein